MIVRRLMVSLAASLMLTAGGGVQAKYCGPPPLPQPAAPMPNPDRLIMPPGEAVYLPVRQDGLPVYLNIDEHVNLTQFLNRYYFNPHWRGEEWGPFPQPWIVERATRMMSLWHEYDEENEFGVGNRWARFLEKYSGYGTP